MLTLFFRLFQQKRNKSDFFVKEIFLDSGLRNLKVIYDPNDTCNLGAVQIP
jgi:hypothetical protein